MTTTTMALAGSLMTMAALGGFGAGPQGGSSPAPGGALEAAARQVLAARDEATADAAIARLRAAGPEGLQTFLEVHAGLAATEVAVGVDPAPEVARFRAALDRVAAQRDAWSARLFWFTDLDAAQREARRTGRPILSLRLLGRLDEELSCANSRFFRTALYPDAKINALLRDGFVLHWSSERAVPRVTIDYGDGRRLERTVTGNSIHYVLAADGTVLDALPGLYGPGRFASELQHARAFANPAIVAGFTLPGRAIGRGRTAVQEHATAVLERLRSPALQAELSRAMMMDPAAFLAVPKRGAAAAPAFGAGLNALSKGVVEAPLLPVAVGAPGEPRIPAALPSNPFAEECRLDAASLRVFAHKSTREVAADAAAMRRAVAAFEQVLAADTLRNELWLRPRILERLAAGPVAMAGLNRQVYDEVFLTPADDPWLGLVTPDVYTGIEAGGVSTVAGAPRIR